MPFFTKKPVQIEARQYDGTPASAAALVKWIADCGREAMFDPNQTTWMFIETLEGTHRANPGDWIIKGVAGEFYPCKPEIFAATYTAAQDENSSTEADQ